MLIFKVPLDFLKFGVLHAMLIPFLLNRCTETPDWIPNRYDHVVLVKELNIRVDSTMDAYTPGIIKENQPIQVLHEGKDWLKVSVKTFFYHKKNASKNKELDWSEVYVWKEHIGPLKQKPGEVYFLVFLVIHLIGLSWAVYSSRPRYITSFLNYLFSLWTPLLFFSAIFYWIFPNEQRVKENVSQE